MQKRFNNAWAVLIKSRQHVPKERFQVPYVYFFLRDLLGFMQFFQLSDGFNCRIEYRRKYRELLLYISHTFLPQSIIETVGGIIHFRYRQASCHTFKLMDQSVSAIQIPLVYKTA